jgi:hypothetical protein
MKTILVPLDGSIQAEQVLPYVSTLARLLEARICLLRVIADEEDGLLAETIVAACCWLASPTCCRSIELPTATRS